jgi:F-type H+-transporting ATPase subunit epsilon
MADHAQTSSGSLQCIVVTPETTALDTTADFVALPLFDGEAGVAPGRAPLIGRLGYGELRVRTGSATKRFYVDGGFVQVADNIVSVLTNRAVPAEKLDTAAATAQLEAAISRPTAGQEELAIRERQISQARGQLRVASRAR